MEQNMTTEERNLMDMQAGAAGTQAAPGLAPATSVVQSVEPVAEKKKDNKWMLLLLILFLLLGIGGVGFGAWSMIDGNTKVEDLKSQVATLKTQNSKLTEEVADLNTQIEEMNEAANNPGGGPWGSTDVVDGVFRVLDAGGNVILDSSSFDLTVNEILGCEASDDNTVLTCTVDTSAGEGWFLYDVFGDTLGSSFERE